MTKTDFNVLSSDNAHTLRGVVYLPDAEPLGFLHIVHGMTEHIGRYDKFMQDMTNAGYICFGYDNLGHGKTAEPTGEFGYISASKGYEYLAKDVKLFSSAVMAKFAQNNNPLPYYLLGHSMGSFITRLAVSNKYVSPNKFIIMGTGGKNLASGLGLMVIRLIKLLRGKKHVSPFIEKLAFGSYNKRFGGGTKADPSPWLTNDLAHREKYYADKFCTFKFTVSAMGDLIKLNKITNLSRWYKNIPNNLPILLVSGENDPVGNYGKGIKEVYKRLTNYDIPAKCILYPEARHEILNDFTYTATKNDILDFLKV